MKLHVLPPCFLFLVLSVALPVLGVSGCAKKKASPETETPELTSTQAQETEETKTVQDIRIIMKTGKGEIHGTLFATKVPITTANFLNLARRGYYDGVTFHRVIANFMIQGGDPTATGSGGPGYRFGDEIAPDLRHSKPGIFSMANAGPNTNGSQFFITHVATPHLDGKHAVFGEVTKGQDVVDAIQQGDEIHSIEILDDAEPLFEAQAARVEEWNSHLK